MIQHLHSIPATLPWFGMLLAGILGMFTLYAGLALMAALFHPRPSTRRLAARMFEHLVNVAFLRRPL